MDKVTALPTSRTDSDEDWSLVLARMAETGDRALFVKVFQHFAPLLKAYMLRLGVLDSVVEELVQESMLTVWRKAKLYQPQKAAAGAWIYTLARNQAIDWMRKQKYPTCSFEVWHEDAIESDQEPGERRLISERLMQAIEQLPEEQAQVIYMSFYEGRSHGEIAKRLAIPLGSVKSRIRLAAEKLRNSWEGNA